LIPGLADMHVHLEHFEDPGVLRLFVASGVTTVRNMDGRGYILDWRKSVADGQVLGPTIWSAGPLLDGDPPLWPDNTVVPDGATATRIVESYDSIGYDFVKVYTNLSAESYRAVIATASRRGLPVAGHVPRSIELDEALAGGQVSIEHLADYADWIEAESSPFFGGWHWSKLYLGMPIDSTRMQAAARRIASSGVWSVPTLVQGYRAVASEAVLTRWLEAAELDHLAPEDVALWAEQVRGGAARMDDADWAPVASGESNRRRLVDQLDRSGARLLVGTDTPNPFVVPGNSLLEELSMFVAAGVTPHATLAAATRDAATFLGEPDEWGTISEGARADLVLLSADPLSDIVNVARRVGVMVRGDWMPESALRASLEGVVAR
jgi:imidazolonepropionase-like amidohydrolase